MGVSPAIIWSTIGITSSMGMAKPRPMEPPCSLVLWDAVRIEELMPTTAPVMSTSGPPELPGLMAASVWIAGYVVELPWLSVPTLTGRSSALTMPLVTVESRPNGAPKATTSWPTSRLADLPIVAGVRPLTPVRLDDRGVGERVGAEDLGRGAGAVGEVDADGAAAGGDLHHVVVGEDGAVGAEDDPRAGALALLAGHLDGDHGRQDRVGHRLDGAVGRGGVALVDDRGAWRSAVADEDASVALGLVPERGAAEAGAAAHEQGGRQHAGHQPRPSASGRGRRRRLLVGVGPVGVRHVRVRRRVLGRRGGGTVLMSPSV